MTTEMHTWDAVETAARIRDGEVKPREVVEAAISRAEAAHDVGAIVTATFDQALAEADRARPNAGSPAGSAASPFVGVPTLVKDLDDVAGVPTGFGSQAFDGYVPRSTSPTVAQFFASGVVNLGKSAAPEFGLTATTEPVGRPPTRNPWNLDHTVGGSSGGAAAAVAAGIVPIAYATDGGGSIRIPASCCGLVGLKPSRGRLVELPNMQGLPLKLAVHNVVTRSVRDTAAYLAAAERHAGSPAHLPTIGHVVGGANRRLRVALVTESPTGVAVDPEVVAATEAVGRHLEHLGHHVDHIPSPVGAEFEDDFLLYWAMLAAGVRLVGLQLMGRGFDASRLDPWTRGLAATLKRQAHHIPTSIARLRRFTSTYGAMFSEFDVLVSPTLATPPPALGHLDANLPYQEHLDRVREFVSFTPVQNVAGAPAVSIPAAVSSGGLPIGVQLAGVVGDDRTMLELAFDLEEAIGWDHLAPAYR